MHVLAILEGVWVCTFTSEQPSLQAGEEERDLRVCSYLLSKSWECYTRVSVQPAVLGEGDVQACVHESLSLSLWDTHSDSLVVEPTSNQESSRHVHQPGTDTPGSLAWAPEAEQEEPPDPRADRGV